MGCKEKGDMLRKYGGFQADGKKSSLSPYLLPSTILELGQYLSGIR